MKKNRSMRLAVVLLALTLITTCFVSGTFAKYTSSTAVSGSATVAQWDIEINGLDITTATQTFDLFATIKDSDGNTEDEVATDLIAPGTSGSFTLEIENKSEVDAKYTLALSENANDVPLEFRVGTGAWTSDISTLGVTAADLNMGGDPSLTVEWRWVYEGGTDALDEADTDLGVAAQTTSEEVTITATLTAWQVD